MPLPLPPLSRGPPRSLLAMSSPNCLAEDLGGAVRIWGHFRPDSRPPAEQHQVEKRPSWAPGSAITSLTPAGHRSSSLGPGLGSWVRLPQLTWLPGLTAGLLARGASSGAQQAPSSVPWLEALLFPTSHTVRGDQNPPACQTEGRPWESSQGAARPGWARTLRAS